MSAPVEDVSRLTARYQTTVPSAVRRHLKLGKGDQIRYRTEPGGRVYIELAVEPTPSDPALGAFLDLLEGDMRSHPEHLAAFDGALADRLAELVGDVEFDLDQPLCPDDE
ncbi:MULTISPECIES: type II toxin-antitoxin system PrlF family antitoxin [unclassified Aureimonas]|uniref:type II toxin-antitoxin system PrlF family antitoxin n=1 Tax=unclassified Aureimonas TaxID=2615206 RepID=UPI0006F46E53|nr:MULTISPECIES: type II toxin-antitoxin system PrlF family antitoxin [unclassified Aureimonas]KQT65120.1 regulator [Aureimonas sp. Leaf427]KQT76230.1 regulator [Aureimonas sp. Leaf460]